MLIFSSVYLRLRSEFHVCPRLKIIHDKDAGGCSEVDNWWNKGDLAARAFNWHSSKSFGAQDSVKKSTDPSRGHSLQILRDIYRSSGRKSRSLTKG